jgi:hypothetical protein
LKDVVERLLKDAVVHRLQDVVERLLKDAVQWMAVAHWPDVPARLHLQIQVNK